jgi:hypothetical protein
MKAAESRQAELARFAAPGLAVGGLVVAAAVLIGSIARVDEAASALDRVRRADAQIDAELQSISARADATRRTAGHWQALEALARLPGPKSWPLTLQEAVERLGRESMPLRILSTSSSPPRPPAGKPASLLLHSEATARFALRHEGHLPRLLDVIESTPHVRVRACRLERVVSQAPARITADCRLSWLSVALPAIAKTP